MTAIPASFQGDDNLDYDSAFDRWWKTEVHPTVKPSIHSRTTHLSFARAMVQQARNLDAAIRGELVEQSRDYFDRHIAGDR